MAGISEQDANTLIDEHLRSRGWDLTNFSLIRRNRSLGELFPQFKGRFPKEAAAKRPDYAFFFEGNPPVLLEAKRPPKDLYGALQEAKEKAKLIKEHTGIEVSLIYASDGRKWLRQNLRARTLPEKLDQFPTPEEFRESLNPVSAKLNPKHQSRIRDFQRLAVSQEVYEDLEALEREMLVVRPKRGKNVERQEIAIEQEAAEDVKQILETVPQDKKQSVDELMQRYGSMGFEQLLDYVYAKYPQFAVKSKRKGVRNP